MNEGKERKAVLAVGSHPDDVELGCAGALLKHLELGEEVFIIIMTGGERGKHVTDRSECIESMKIMGIKESNIIFGEFPDTYLPEHGGAVDFIERHVKEFKPYRIYTHCAVDRHQDHRNCSNAVTSAARRIHGAKVPDLLLFEGPSTKEPFEPHYFIELSEKHMEVKLKALTSYQSQIEKGIVNLRAIHGLALFRGSKVDTHYAEAFALNHMCAGGKDV